MPGSEDSERLLFLLLLLALLACGPPRPSVAELQKQIQETEDQIRDLEASTALSAAEEGQGRLRKLREVIAIDDCYYNDKTKIGQEVSRVVKSCGQALSSLECDRETRTLVVQVTPARAESIARQLGLTAGARGLEGRLPERGGGPDVSQSPELRPEQEPLPPPARTQNEYQVLSEHLKQSQSKLAECQEKIKNLPLITKQVEEQEKLVRARWKKLNGSSEHEYEDSSLLRQHLQAELTAAARKRGLKVTRFVTGGDIYVPWNQPITPSLSSLPAVEASLTVTGPTPAVAAFLTDVEEGRAHRFDVITHVRLVPKKAQVDLVALRM